MRVWSRWSGLVARAAVRGADQEVLGTPAASRIVAQVVGAQLETDLESPPRGAKQQARSVLDKVLAAAQARIAAREHRDNQRRKSALASSSLPAKLVDCRSADDRSELFIVEGDSALGTAKLARNSEFQALFPIRGKILNVQKASLADMLKNSECAAIIQVIGARPGRNPHMALDALHTALMSQRVNWVLDADIRSFFDSVDHEWLMRMLAHRIADRRILRLIRMWLEAGILESGEWCETDRGTPQGAGISPLLANVFLHYVLDLWVQQWRRRRARGRVVIVRYADDFVMGFEKTDDARRMMAALTERLAKFGLAIHDEKTRLIEFGRLPALARRQRGLRRPETFAFLGFTHYCGWTRDGRFIVKLKTQSKRLTRKLKALRQEAWRLMHVPLAVQHRWYTSVLLGHYGYYGRPQNFPALIAFRQEVLRIWLTCLRRRSQKTRRMSWQTFAALLTSFPLPTPRITHPWTVRAA